MPDTRGTTEQAAAPAAESLEDRVHAALRGVYDPEIPVNIHDLGLIYDVRIAAGGKVDIKMTLTAPGCPVAGTMPGMVEQAVAAVDGISHVDVELVWDPPWNQDMMSDVARLELGFM
ncbi:MAG: SUF system Fe-S cluster assembly protein [Alphaproteobacteria bacterium]|nr:SUF system Fe-S cluster assembly protein [Alphaproteobacteria bacterium]